MSAFIANSFAQCVPGGVASISASRVAERNTSRHSADRRPGPRAPDFVVFVTTTCLCALGALMLPLVG